MDGLTPETVVIFRRRWIRVLLTTALVVIPIAMDRTDVPMVADLPIGQSLLLIGSLMAIWGLVFWWSWRCPACDKRPSDHWRPLYCGHCGVPLLGGGGEAAAPRKSREEWYAEEERWYRSQHQLWAMEYAFLLILLVLVIFFCVFYGFGGRPEASRWVALGVAAVCAFFGWLAVGGMHRQFEASGLPPDRVERGVGGLMAVAAGVMIFVGFGGLMYVLIPVDPRQPGWVERLRLENAESLALACASYTLAGMFLYVLGRRRGDRS